MGCRWDGAICEQALTIQRERLVRWLETRCLLVGLVTAGVGVVVVWVLLQLGLRKAIRDWAESLSYGIRNDALCIRQHFQVWGILLFTTEKVVPLEKITDVTLVRGPLQLRYGVSSLKIQTPGAGSQIRPEARLHALTEPERTRERLLGQAQD